MNTNGYTFDSTRHYFENMQRAAASNLNSQTQHYQDAMQNGVYNACADTEPSTSSIGLLNIYTANSWMRMAAEIPDPVFLWKEFFVQGEVCCLFADTNAGKSILAVQIASDIAMTGQKVLYLDFELTSKQFETRYRDEKGGQWGFPPRLIRGEITLDSYEGNNFEERLISDIRDGALFNQCKVVIIDNLTWLTSTAEKGEAAARLMKELLNIKKAYGLSILVLAHTPKRALNSPITQNDLAGSKQLINFFDAAFSIGKSVKDESLRYLKQIKSRSTEIKYGADNVIVCEIEKENGYLHFRELNNSPEAEHITEPSDKQNQDLQIRIRNLKDFGKTIRQIAQDVGISKSKVARILNQR